MDISNSRGKTVENNGMGGTTRVQNTSLIKAYSPSTEQHLPSGVSELLLASDYYEPPILLKFKYLIIIIILC